MWELIQNNWTLIFAALFFVFMLRMHGGAGHRAHDMHGMHGAQQEEPTEVGERPLLIGAESSAPGKDNSSSPDGG